MFKTIFLFIIYVIAIIPIGIMMKLFGQDPLLLKLNKGASTYWIKRKSNELTVEGMKSQF